jgi:hypothetical protein
MEGCIERERAIEIEETQSAHLEEICRYFPRSKQSPMSVACGQGKHETDHNIGKNMRGSPSLPLSLPRMQTNSSRGSANKRLKGECKGSRRSPRLKGECNTQNGSRGECSRESKNRRLKGKRLKGECKS